jgi:hypothetical protein
MVCLVLHDNMILTVTHVRIQSGFNIIEKRTFMTPACLRENGPSENQSRTGYVTTLEILTFECSASI